MQLSNCGHKNMIAESSTVAIALPSTSQTEVKLNAAATDAARKTGANDASVGKTSKKKKKKKKAKKQPKDDSKNPTLVNSSLDSCRNTVLGSTLPINLEKNELSGSILLKSKQLGQNQAEHVFVNDTNNRDIGYKNLNGNLVSEPDATAGLNRQISVPVDRLTNIDGDSGLSPSLGNNTYKFELRHAGMNSFLSRGQSEIKNAKHCHSDHKLPALKYQEDLLESGHDHAVKFAGKSLSCNKSTIESEDDKKPAFSARKPEAEVDVNEFGSYKSSMNGHLKIREVPRNTGKWGLDDTLPRESYTKHAINSVKPEFERQDHVDNKMKSSRDGFWTRRTSEGPESSSYRNRVNQRSFNSSTLGESKFALPFWRHQAVDLHRTAHPWSKPSLSRRDEWITDRGAMPSARQVKNISPWELPDLRKSGTNRGFGHNWESGVAAEESFLQGQKGSINSQRQNRGKSYEMPFRNTRNWLPEDALKAVHSSVSVLAHETPQQNTKDCLVESTPGQNCATEVLNPETFCSSEAPSVPSAGIENQHTGFSDVDKSGGTHNDKDIAKNLPEEAVAPVVSKESTSTILQGNDSINCCDDRCNAKDASTSSGYQPLRSQVIDHVCNIVDAVRVASESIAVYEQVSKGLGGPLCEFEKFANAVAPILRIPKPSLERDESTGSLCMNAVTGSCKNRYLQQLTDVPLSAIWEWYEEPSCFGVKVKLAECRDNVNCEYQAFFVPFLSGVQLFGWKNKRKTNCKETDSNQNSSDLFNASRLSPPILSVLLPKATIDNDINIKILSQNNTSGVENSKLGSFTNGLKHCDYDIELLYEFFEGESPPQRRPFAEKIVQLAGASSGSDASVLTSVKIGQVHPSSWFAVAWYPIYRIPDGTFRSTFLTYHSLSSLQQSTPTNCSQSFEHNRVTLPMVGYMSYNAQAKDWFSLTSHYSSKGETSRLFDANPAEVLQNHLTKLDATAVAMARGSTDNLSGFKHLDYNFFQNRRK